jgi:hypothetical protein
VDSNRFRSQEPTAQTESFTSMESFPKQNITTTPCVSQVGYPRTEATAVPSTDGTNVVANPRSGVPENTSKKEGPALTTGPEIYKAPNHHERTLYREFIRS